MNSITADSFLYRSKLQPSKKANRKRLSTSTSKSKLEVAATIPFEEVESKVPIVQTLDILQAYRIYVDRKLHDHDYFEQLSKALGAIVVQDPKEGISILVHGPRDNKGRLSKLAYNALDNHVHVVSPVWLRECYVSGVFHDPYLYPCDFKDKTKLTKPMSFQDDNPFGLTIDVLESTSVTQTTTTQNIPQEEAHQPQQQEEEVEVEEKEEEASPEPEIRGMVTESRESSVSVNNIERQRSPKEVVTDNAKVRELLERKRKEKEDEHKAEGSAKKKKKDGTLTSFFGSSSKMSIRYGESSRIQYF